MCSSPVTEMGWWDDFSVARFFDSPTIFAVVMGITGLFVLFYVVVAARASRLERAASVWAGNRSLAELVDALDGPNAELAFVRIRYMRSERHYRQLLKRRSISVIETLLADLPDDKDTKWLRETLLSPGLDKNRCRDTLLRLLERRDEELQRLLMARLRNAKERGPISVYPVYLLEDLAASEARPLLERLLARRALPERVLKSALRRIPQAQQASAK